MLKNEAAEEYTYFPVVLYKVVQSVESVEEIPEVWPLKSKLLSSTFPFADYYAVQVGSYFSVCGSNPKVRLFK